jgi:hypothetical protein
MDYANGLTPEGRLKLGTFPIPRGRMAIELIVSDFSQNEKNSLSVVSVE